jgi:hypothetical protein
MSELTIPGVAAHLICKSGIVLMTVALVQTGGAGMPAAAMAPTIDRSVLRASDASAASSVTAVALIVATLIASTLIPTTLITAALLVASMLLALTLVALLVATRLLTLADSGSCHSMVGWILGLRLEFGGGSLTVASAGFVYLRVDWLQKLGGVEQHWRWCWFRRS